MIKIKKIPKNCQFAAVWEYDGEVWSGTFMIKSDGKLYSRSDRSAQSFDIIELCGDFLKNAIIYIY